MTPQKEKAQELFKSFFPDLRESLDLELVGIRKKHAVKYALIAVDEIISACEYNQVETYNTDWWNKVKEEINNL